MELPLITKSVGYSSSSMPMAFDVAPNAHLGLHGNPIEGRIIDHGLLKLKDPVQFINQIVANTGEKIMPSVRIVRVFIADPNENIALDKRVIYKSDEILTDLTDQELFFEADPAGILKKHNEYRVTVHDKKAMLSRPEVVMLEPARIRDLRMVVVDIASF